MHVTRRGEARRGSKHGGTVCVLVTVASSWSWELINGFVAETYATPRRSNTSALCRVCHQGVSRAEGCSSPLVFYCVARPMGKRDINRSEAPPPPSQEHRHGGALHLAAPHGTAIGSCQERGVATSANFPLSFQHCAAAPRRPP